MIEDTKGAFMKQVWIMVFILIGFSSAADARIDRYDEKGLKVYKKYCKKCHGNSYKGAAMKRESQWQKLFRDDAKIFIALHKNIPEAKEIEALTKRKSKTKHLRKFLMQSASDSGVVSTCDGNFCGR